MHKALLVGLSVLLIGGLIAVGRTAAKSGASGSVATPSDGRFVVHEWGTFTSFSGSDSVKLEFRPLADVDLPKFVLNRQRQSGYFDPLSKFDITALQRMETPVTYFYTDKPMQVKVRVDFPQGLLTEFFPPVEKMEPAIQEPFEWLPPDKIGNSSLDWGKVWLIPESNVQSSVTDPELKDQLNARIRKKLLPSAVVGDHYTFARETDSALVYVEHEFDKKLPLKPYGGFFEKFLFYRGIGNFELPLKLTAESDGRFELFNLGTAPIRQLFLVTVDDKQLRFQHYSQIGAGQKMPLEQSTQASSVEALSEAVTAALVEEHLYEKEARSMVKTWSSSWFGEQGTRLFYVLPTGLTDELLPLSIEPKPAEIVRVMVGRLEIMRPEDEERVTKLILQSVIDRTAALRAQQEDPQNAKPYQLPKEIVELGRLAEPALIRMRNISTDENMTAEATQLLLEYNAYRKSIVQAQAAKQ